MAKRRRPVAQSNSPSMSNAPNRLRPVPSTSRVVAVRLLVLVVLPLDGVEPLLLLLLPAGPRV